MVPYLRCLIFLCVVGYTQAADDAATENGTADNPTSDSSTVPPYPVYPNDGWDHPVNHSTVTVLEGSNITLYCNNATPGEYYGIYWTNLERWKRSRYVYGYRTDHAVIIDPYLFGRVSLENASLKIDRVKDGDSGLYDCTLVYFYYRTGIPRGTTWATHRVNVLVFPVVEIDKTHAFPREGEDVIFNCNVTRGTEPVNVSWTAKDGSELKSKIGTKYEIRNNGTQLLIRNATRQDNGGYRCHGKNAFGNHSAIANLRAKVPPVITADATTVHINVDQDGSLRCRAKSFPLSKYKWNIKFENGSKYTLRELENYNQHILVAKTRLVVKDISESHMVLKNIQKAIWNYRYSCVAFNSEGKAEQDFQVKGFDYPSRPSIRQIKISATVSTIYWSLNDNGGTPLTAVVFSYRNISQMGWSKVRVSPVLSTAYDITGLTPDTSYEFKLWAENEVGRSIESGVYGARTQTQEKPNIQQASPAANVSSTAVIGISAGIFVALLVVLCCIFIVYRRIKKPLQRTNREMVALSGMPTTGEMLTTRGIEIRTVDEPIGEHEPLVPKIDGWEFPRDRLKLGCVLGSGAFGLVRRAEAEGIQGSNGRVKVAVKMLKEGGSLCARKDLLAELDVLKFIPAHPNIVCLLGCCTRSDPVLVIVEYCANGDLQGFLRNSRGINERYYRNSYGGTMPNLTCKMLLTFGHQVARGMEHLASLKVIHRDLAARNILVDENLTCKVGDFGFARDVYIEDHYMRKSHNGRFPVKWMAIESLVDTISTSKSDVWSFGVVLWEIITLGASPYPGMNAYEVVTFLQDGYRMDKPKHCSDELYALLIDCWHVWPQRRPSFTDLAEILKRMRDGGKEHINMNYYQDHLYVNFDLPTSGTSSSMSGATHGGPLYSEELHG